MGTSTTHSDSASSNPAHRKPVKWPLRFKSHNFEARCYDTLDCSVIYDNFDHGEHEPTRSSASYGPDYLKGWRGGYLGVHNVPEPAKVTWRTKDGVEHRAEIDIGEIFKDKLIRHNVAREELSEFVSDESLSDPSILLEVNDHTIRVYMSAFIPTRHEQTPGNKYSDFRDDVILVRTYAF